MNEGMKTMNRWELAGTVASLLLVLTFVSYEGAFVVRSVFRHLDAYVWCLTGVALYVVAERLGRWKNLDFLQVHAHEWAHAWVSLLFFRKVHSLEANTREGQMYYTPGRYGNLFIVLAPYCLPYLTYLCLFVRCFVQPSYCWLFDVLAGGSLAFHVACFYRQTHPQQPDLRCCPLAVSYLFIWTFRLFNLLVILLCFLPKQGRCYNLGGALGYLWDNLWRDLGRLMG